MPIISNFPSDIGGSKFNMIATDVDVPASGWTGNAPPYKQILQVPSVTKYNYVNISPCKDITYTQYQNLITANIIGSAQDEGLLELSAFGKKPSLDLPLEIVTSNPVSGFRGDKGFTEVVMKKGQSLHIDFHKNFNELAEFFFFYEIPSIDYHVATIHLINSLDSANVINIVLGTTGTFSGAIVSGTTVTNGVFNVNEYLVDGVHVAIMPIIGTAEVTVD